MTHRVQAGLVALGLVVAACTPAQIDSAQAPGPSPDATPAAPAERDIPSQDVVALPSPTSAPSVTAPAAAAQAWSPSEGAATDATTAAGDASAAQSDADGDGDGGADQDATNGAPRLVAVDLDARGGKVERLQRRLDALGFAPGAVDGAYGPRTQRAVEAFQMLAGLKQTGRADAKTVAALADYEPDVALLEAGDTGKAVRQLQRRLAKGPFDPGPADGAYGTKTVEAVWALEKLAGVPVDGEWGPLDDHALAKLEDGKIGRATKRHDTRWVEFDLSEQVLTVYDPGSTAPFLVSHGSSGSGVPWENEEHSGTSVTPPGDFVISRRIDGWRESSLDIGRLYNPLYFNGGIAFHGALSVPLYPASHGCIRLPMHIAEYLPRELPDGTPVHILQ